MNEKKISFHYIKEDYFYNLEKWLLKNCTNTFCLRNSKIGLNSTSIHHNAFLQKKKKNTKYITYILKQRFMGSFLYTNCFEKQRNPINNVANIIHDVQL